MKSHYINRQSERMPVSMTLTSTSLPAPPAELIELSDQGGRIRLSSYPQYPLENACIPTKVALPCNSQALFEGAARVIWVKKNQGGAEMGLQWTIPTARSWQRAKAILLGE